MIFYWISTLALSALGAVEANSMQLHCEGLQNEMVFLGKGKTIPHQRLLSLDYAIDVTAKSVTVISSSRKLTTTNGTSPNASVSIDSAGLEMISVQPLLVGGFVLKGRLRISPDFTSGSIDSETWQNAILIRQSQTNLVCTQKAS